MQTESPSQNRPAGFYGRLQALLERPRIASVMMAASLLLMGLSLNTGLAADDWLHGIIVRGDHGIDGFAHNSMDLFRFASGESTQQLIDQGVLSWWADPEARLAFFRPISSFTHYLDHTLWPDAHWMMHLHSMLWGLATFLGVLAVYRRLINPRWVVMLAFYFYVLDDARAWFASWIAARNAVVAMALSVWTLYFYHRHRVEGMAAGARWGPVFLLLGLLSGEGSISICAYLFAHALFLQQGPLRGRLLSLSPYAAVVLLWRAVYVWMGYGTGGSGLYVDPLGDPTLFLAKLAERVPVLLFAQLGGPWSDVWTSLFVFPALGALFMFGALVLIALTAYVAAPLWRKDPLVRFGVVGACLSLVPASATFPADRLLPWVALGACPMLARIVQAHVEKDADAAPTPRRRFLLMALSAHLVLNFIFIGPPTLASRARGNVALRDVLGRADESVPTDPSIAHKTLVYVNPPAVPLAAYVTIGRAFHGRPYPKRQRWLATSTTELELERLDARTLRVRPRGGFLLNPASQLMRVAHRGFREGQVIELPEVTITVTQLTSDGRPAEIRARFLRDLEDPSLVWKRWDDVSYADFQLPAVGQSVTLPAVDYLRVIFGDAMDLPFKASMTPASP